MSGKHEIRRFERTKKIRSKYPEDDPLHYLAVARRDREKKDPPTIESQPGFDSQSPIDETKDRDWYRKHPNG